MKVKVLNECVVDGTTRAPGDVVETIEENATALIKDGFAEAVPEDVAPDAPPADEAPADPPASPEGGDVATPPAAPDAPPAPVAYVVAQEDLDANPLLATLAAEVGDTLTVTKAST